GSPVLPFPIARSWAVARIAVSTPNWPHGRSLRARIAEKVFLTPPQAWRNAARCHIPPRNLLRSAGGAGRLHICNLAERQPCRSLVLADDDLPRSGSAPRRQGGVVDPARTESVMLARELVWGIHEPCRGSRSRTILVASVIDSPMPDRIYL